MATQDVFTSLSSSYITADDYFRRLGGSGQYAGFEFWQPAALVILLTLKVAGKISEEQIEKIKFELPYQLLTGYAGIATRLEEAVSRYGPYELSGAQNDLHAFWERFEAMKPDKLLYQKVNERIRFAISNLV